MHRIFMGFSCVQVKWLAMVWIFAGCVSKDTPSKATGLDGAINAKNGDLAADAFYNKVKDMNRVAADSLYMRQFAALEQQNQNSAVVSNFEYYTRLNPETDNRTAPFWLKAATAYQNMGKYDSSLVLLKEIIPVFTGANNSKSLGLAYRASAIGYQNIKELPLAVDYLYKSMQVFNSARETKEYYNSMVELATIFFFLKEYPKSLQLHTDALKYFEQSRDTAQMAYALDGITVAYDNMDELGKADTSGHRSLQLYQAISDARGRSVSLNNLAHLYKRRGDLHKAEPFLREGLQIMEEMQDARYIPVCQSNLGNCLLELNKLDEAEAILLKAKEGVERNGNTREIANVELALAKLYEQKGVLSKSLLFRKSYEKLRDTLYSRDRLNILAETGARYESKVKEAEITRLKYEQEMYSLYKIIILFGSLGLLALIGGWFLARIRRQKAVFEKEKEILAEKDRAQAAELRLAKSELESFALSFHEKNRLLDEISAKFQASPEAFSTPTAAYNFMADLYHQRILTDQDWENFKQQFDLVYPNYVIKIKSNFPEISQAELRLLLLLKLNLETREIAGMLGISPDTVKKTRQRLRKRLNLNEETSLEDFVRKI